MTLDIAKMSDNILKLELNELYEEEYSKGPHVGNKTPTDPILDEDAPCDADFEEYELYDRKEKPRSLKIAYFNIAGIGQPPRDLRPDIKKFLLKHRLDMMLIQETLLTPEHRSWRFDHSGNYLTVRNDKTGTGTQGTLIIYRKELDIELVETPPLLFLEASIVKVHMTDHPSITIGSVYARPIHSNSDKKTAQTNDSLYRKGHSKKQNDKIRMDLKTLYHLSDSVILAGDFNAKNVVWNSTLCCSRGRFLKSLSQNLQFDIIGPTQYTYYPYKKSNKPNVLDIALLRNVSLNHRIYTIGNELNYDIKSDHRPVILELFPELCDITHVSRKRVKSTSAENEVAKKKEKHGIENELRNHPNFMDEENVFTNKNHTILSFAEPSCSFIDSDLE